MPRHLLHSGKSDTGATLTGEAQGRAGQGRAGQGRAGQGSPRHGKAGHTIEAQHDMCCTCATHALHQKSGDV